MHPFTVSDSAKARVAAMLTQEEPLSFFRISVMAGGCSGLQYTFTIDKVITPDDLYLVDSEHCKIVIDDISLSFVSDGILDFEEELVGSKFVINNPNAKMGCGCGKSFSI